MRVGIHIMCSENTRPFLQDQEEGARRDTAHAILLTPEKSAWNLMLFGSARELLRHITISHRWPLISWIGQFQNSLLELHSYHGALSIDPRTV